MGEVNSPTVGTMLSVDKLGTVVHEDALGIVQEGDITRITIGAVIPPREIPEKLLIQVLNDELLQVSKKPVTFLNLSERLKYSFNTTHPRKSLIATYEINGRDELILEDLSVSEITVAPVTMEDYGNSAECMDTINNVLRVLWNKPNLHYFGRIWQQRSYDESWGPAHYMINMALQLFNNTCRDAAKKECLFFMERPNPYTPYFKTYGEQAVFNRTLRDVTAYINASNMASFLLDEPCVYGQQFLIENLPPGSLFGA